MEELMRVVRDLKHYLKQWHLSQRLSDSIRFPQLHKLLDIHYGLRSTSNKGGAPSSTVRNHPRRQLLKPTFSSCQKNQLLSVNSKLAATAAESRLEKQLRKACENF